MAFPRWRTGARAWARDGPSCWLFDIDDLAWILGVTLDRARLAELRAQAALAGMGQDVEERLARIEHDLADLRRSIDRLQRSMDGLREGDEKVEVT